MLLKTSKCFIPIVYNTMYIEATQYNLNYNPLSSIGNKCNIDLAVLLGFGLYFGLNIQWISFCQ